MSYSEKRRNKQMDAILARENAGIRPKQRGSRAFRKFTSNKIAVLGLILFLVISVLSFGAPLFTQYDPLAMDLRNMLKPPTSVHWFGTDSIGRDLFARVLYGARSSLTVGCAVAVMACFFGTVIGIYASYFKVADAILMRICEGLTAIPGILLAIALMAALGASRSRSLQTSSMG